MTKISRLSDKLFGYEGGNPFAESQARAFSDEKISREFHPITLFWSLFNEQHEILVGTRGSGKTVILRMLSYSCLRLSRHPDAIKIKESKRFIGIYIPLHLEFMASLRGRDVPDNKRIEYFQFAVNCSAATSFISELKWLLEDSFLDPLKRLTAQREISHALSEMWFPGRARLPSLEAVHWEIKVLFENQEFWEDGTISKLPPLATSLFSPVLSVLAKITGILGLDIDNTKWIACIDESEFLTPAFIKCLNNFMRSSKKPLILKIATLPFKHSTKETLTEGVFVEAGGNDFNYRTVDRKCDSADFIGLTNHLLSARLANCGIDFGKPHLEDFLGTVGNDAPIDYFRLELAPHYQSDEDILEDISKSLSPVRRKKLAETVDPALRQSAFLKKFSPVYYVRKLRAEEANGNRTVGWFAGAPVLRRISDGNPRRFIQLMNDMVESARKNELTPKNQHRVNTDFCARIFEASEGLQEMGAFLNGLLKIFGRLLHARIHEGDLVNGGCDFRLSKEAIQNKLLLQAIHLGVAYTLIVCDETDLYNGIRPSSILALSNLCAVKFWLPMRKSDPPIVITASRIEGISSGGGALAPTISKSQSEDLVNQLELQLTETSDAQDSSTN